MLYKIPNGCKLKGKIPKGKKQWAMGRKLEGSMVKKQKM